MEGRMKTRQPGSIPNTLGRQVGVLPVSSRHKAHRPNGDKSTSIPIGGTDIQPDAGQPKPPSGSAPRGSASSKSHLASGSRNKLDSKSTTSITSSHNDTMERHSESSSIQSRMPSKSSAARNRPTNYKSPSASSRGLPGSSRVSSTNSLKSPSGTALSKKSPSGSASRHTDLSTSRHQQDHFDEESLADEPPEQDIKFTNVPSKPPSRPGSSSRPGSASRPGSKSKRSPGSLPGSARSVQDSARSGAGSARSCAGSAYPDGSKKPYKTLDPEAVLAENMESDFHKIYDINLHASEITHIDHMEKFRKVKVLDLSCNFIEQIQNLELCRDVRELKLYDNRLRKIENLENLKELTSLQLQHNRIKQIGKAFSNLKKLKNLRLDCNQLLKIDAPELSPCVQLTVLDISYNMLDSLAALNYLPNLDELNASGNRLRSVSDLGKCKHLQEVDLSNNRITDLSGLRGLPRLMTLNISNNQLTSLKSMGRLRALQDLLASGNQIHELSTVATQLPALETLELTENEITDWDEFYYLEEMPNLVELFIAGNPFCAEDGHMPHYFSAIQAILPNLEIIDGAHIKKHVAKGAPLMRPMSASSIVSLRQMDTQMKSTEEQMQSLEQSLQAKFASLRASCDTLPLEAPGSRISRLGLYEDVDTPASSRCSTRSRILQAKKFAAESVDLE